MSQKRLTDYYVERKRGALAGRESKRRKLVADELAGRESKRQKLVADEVTVVKRSARRNIRQSSGRNTEPFNFDVQQSEVKKSADRDFDVQQSKVKKSADRDFDVQQSEVKKSADRNFDVQQSEVKKSADRDFDVQQSEVKKSADRDFDVQQSEVKKSADRDFDVQQSEVKSGGVFRFSGRSEQYETNSTSTTRRSLEEDDTSTEVQNTGRKSSDTERQVEKFSESLTDERLIDNPPHLNSNAGKLAREEIKKKLSKCGGLDELKRRLKHFNDKKTCIIEKAQTSDASDEIKRVASSVEKPVLTDEPHEGLNVQPQVILHGHSGVKQGENNGSSTSGVRSAYERYDSLAQPVPPATLVLPLTYQLLRELFTSADTTVSLLYKRSEVCTYTKLSEAVQSMTKRVFGMTELGQIKTVYSTAYVYRQERNLHKNGARTSEYQLTITPCLDDDKSSEVIESGRSVFSLNKLIERRTTFFTNLINIVKKYHRMFLDKLGVGRSFTDDKILRWHPRFIVDSVPEIESSDLPQPPDDSTVLRTASDVLKCASNAQRQLNPVLQRALERVAASRQSTAVVENNRFTCRSSAAAAASSSSSKPAAAAATSSSCKSAAAATDSSSSSKPTAAATASSSKPAAAAAASSFSSKTTAAVKGISQSLLDKVRSREAMLNECAMLRDEQKNKRVVMLERLPELMRILRGEFVMKKKSSLPIRDCCARMIDSYKSRLSHDECESHISLMCEVSPNVVSVVRVSSGSYVKFNINISLNDVNQHITTLHKQALLD